MPATIAYDPSLALGHVVVQDLMNSLNMDARYFSFGVTG